MEKVYVYCLEHPFMDDTYKIGLTRRTVEEELDDANRFFTSSSSLFKIKYKSKINYIKEKELILNDYLKTNSEKVFKAENFYKIKYNKVIVLFEQLNKNYFFKINEDLHNEKIEEEKDLHNEKTEEIKEKTIKNNEFKCEKCNVIFKHNFILQRHLKTELHKTGHKKPRENRKEKIICDECGFFSTISEAELFKHKLLYHKSEEERIKEYNYYCKTCKVGFFDIDKFEKHNETKSHKKKILFSSKNENIVNLQNVEQ